MGDNPNRGAEATTSGEVPAQDNPNRETRVQVSVEETPNRDDIRLGIPVLANAIAVIKSFFSLILSWSPWVSLVSVAFSSIITGLKFDNKTVNAIGIVLQIIVAIYALADKRRAQ